MRPCADGGYAGKSWEQCLKPECQEALTNNDTEVAPHVIMLQEADWIATLT